MMRHAFDYFSRLSQEFGSGWTRFWFTPSDPATISAIRLLAGVLVVYMHATLCFDLEAFFGADGLLPAGEIAVLEANTFSYLNYLVSPAELWAVHLLGLAVLIAFAAGFYTRITSVLSMVVFLSTVHRAPIITGRTEIVLAMLMLYLCLAPCGRRFSLDAWLAARNSKRNNLVAASTTATIATRLIQIHLSLLTSMMAFSQLSGEVWWTGDGIWFLMTRPQSRLIDLTGLESSPLIVDLLSHLLVGFELSFPILVWPRLFRPLMLGFGVLVWSFLALITGDLTFTAALLIASVAFVSPAAVLSVAQARRVNVAAA
jgi:hypothetical protein